MPRTGFIDHIGIGVLTSQLPSGTTTSSCRSWGFGLGSRCGGQSATRARWRSRLFRLLRPGARRGPQSRHGAGRGRLIGQPGCRPGGTDGRLHAGNAQAIFEPLDSIRGSNRREIGLLFWLPGRQINIRKKVQLPVGTAGFNRRTPSDPQSRLNRRWTSRGEARRDGDLRERGWTWPPPLNICRDVAPRSAPRKLPHFGPRESAVPACCLGNRSR